MDVRIVLRAFDNSTMQIEQGSSRVVLTSRQVEMVKTLSDRQDITQWAAEVIKSAIVCMEDLQDGI